jgi:hypothetical protein
MGSDKKVDLLVEENGYRITLNPNSDKPEKFINHAYGSYFTACDMELVSSIDGDAREWDTLPSKIKQGFSCRGIATDGWDMGVIGDPYRSKDLMITIYPKSPENVKHMAEWEKSKRADKGADVHRQEALEDFKVSDVMFGKEVADWEIPNSTTQFWMCIDVSQEVFDNLYTLYKEGNLQSLRFRVSFKFGQVYKSAAGEYMPIVQPDTYYLLPHEEWGPDLPEIAYGKLDYLNTAGKRNILKPKRNNLEEYYEEKFEAESQAEEARNRGEYIAPPTSNPEQDMARQLSGIYSNLSELNKTSKYILYALVAIVIVISWLKG